MFYDRFDMQILKKTALKNYFDMLLNEKKNSKSFKLLRGIISLDIIHRLTTHGMMNYRINQSNIFI